MIEGRDGWVIDRWGDIRWVDDRKLEIDDG